MSKPRKTLEVHKILTRANELLALPDGGLLGSAEHVNADFRHGVRALLESVLHQADAYHGFQYQHSEWLPEEERDYTAGKVLRDGYDDTRRIYH